MGNQMKFKKRVSGYFEAPMRLGFFLLLINILILFMHWPSGLVLLVFTICYFVVVLALRMHSRALVINEMVSFCDGIRAGSEKTFEESGASVLRSG